MACPCFPDCGCFLEEGELISIEGTGNNVDPWIISAIETVFDANAGSGITISAGGSYGHEPTISVAIQDTNSVDLAFVTNNLTANVRIDPASTAPVTVGAAGIKIDCCADPAIGDLLTVSDTNTVDLTLAAGNLSADVRIDPDACNIIDDTVSGLLAYQGEYWYDIADGVLRTIPTVGDSAADSWSHSMQNNFDCPIIVSIYGQAVTNSQVTVSGAQVNFDAACRLETDTIAFMGGGFIRSVRINEMTNTGSANPFPAGEGITTSDQLFGHILLPVGGATNVRMYMNSTNFVNLTGGGGGGLGFQFTDVSLRIAEINAARLQNALYVDGLPV